MATSWNDRSKPSTSYTDRTKPTTEWNDEGTFEILLEDGRALLQEDGFKLLLENYFLSTSWNNRVKP